MRRTLSLLPGLILILPPNVWSGESPGPLLNYNLKKHFQDYIYGLVQDCSNSSALAMELLQACTKPSIL